MKKLLFIIAFLLSASLFAQIDESTGFKSRGLTTTQLNSLPDSVKEGLIIYDTTLEKVVCWDEVQSIWVDITSITGDNLGNHMATQQLNMFNEDIVDAQNIEANFFNILNVADDSPGGIMGWAGQSTELIFKNMNAPLGKGELRLYPSGDIRYYGNRHYMHGDTYFVNKIKSDTLAPYLSSSPYIYFDTGEINSTISDAQIDAAGSSSLITKGWALDNLGGGSGGGDNLGNHTATQDLNLGDYNLLNTGEIQFNGGALKLLYNAQGDLEMGVDSDRDFVIKNSSNEITFRFDSSLGAVSGRQNTRSTFVASTIHTLYPVNSLSMNTVEPGSTGFPASNGGLAILKGADGDGEDSMYLFKDRDTEFGYYLGSRHSVNGVTFSRIWTDDYNGGGSGSFDVSAKL